MIIRKAEYDKLKSDIKRLTAERRKLRQQLRVFAEQNEHMFLALAEAAKKKQST